MSYGNRFNKQTNKTLDEQVKEKNYLIARRTMRMWPVKVSAEVKSLTAAARTFCLEILKMPADQAEALQISGVIEAAPSRRGRIKNEIVVTFKTAADRDLVQSFAPNLKELQGKAGVRVDIPEHLQTTFKVLEEHANGIKGKYKEAVRRSIMFDDSSRCLMLDICLPNSSNWHRICLLYTSPSPRDS